MRGRGASLPAKCEILPGGTPCSHAPVGPSASRPARCARRTLNLPIVAALAGSFSRSTRPRRLDGSTTSSPRFLYRSSSKPGGRPPLDLLRLAVGLLGNRVPDAPLPQIAAAGPVAVRLVGRDAVRRLARPARPELRDADLLQNRLELRAVRPLTWCDDQGQRAAAAVRTQVEPGGEPAARAAQTLTSRTTSTRWACRLCHGVCSAECDPLKWARCWGNRSTSGPVERFPSTLKKSSVCEQTCSGRLAGLGHALQDGLCPLLTRARHHSRDWRLRGRSSVGCSITIRATSVRTDSTAGPWSATVGSGPVPRLRVVDVVRRRGSKAGGV